MKKALYIFLPVLILALVWSVNQMQASDQATKVAGTVLGADGNVPALAHVHLSEIGDSYHRALTSEAVREDGSFLLQIAEPGAYKLWITATNHQALGLPLVVEGGENIELQVTQAAHDFKRHPEEVKIIGSWNDYKWNAAEPMEKQADGTFVYERVVEGEQVGYQLLGIVEGGRSVNGTQSDAFEYDGAGDYRSILHAKDGKVRIVFNPDEVVQPKYANLPDVTFDDAHTHLAELHTIQDTYKKSSSEFAKALRAYEEEHGTPKGFSYDFSSLINFLKDNMQNAAHQAVREFAAMHLAYLYYRDADLSARDYQQIAETVGPESAMWQLALRPTVTGLSAERPKAARDLLKNIYANNPDEEVQALALAQLTFYAALTGDRDKQKTLFAELKEKYGEASVVKYYSLMLDPDSSIGWGNPVPAFEMQLIDSDRTVSNESLKGQFYLIDFWATWCGPCVREMPHLHEAYEKFKDRNFTILSISLDKSAEEIQKFRQGWAMPWLHACLNADWKSPLVQDFKVHKTGIPSPFLISPEAKILASHMALRGELLEQTLARYLGSN